MSRQYPNPPIREVVCEFRYQEDGHWDGAAPGLIYSTLSSEFPRRLPVERSTPSGGPPVAESPNLLVPRVQQLELRVGPPETLRFWRASDESGYFSVDPYRWAVHHFRPYPSWKRFSEIVIKGFHAYQEVLQPTKVQRIGLRYINSIDLGQVSVSLEEFLEFYPFVGDKIPQALSRFHCLAQIDFEDARDTLIVQIGSIPRPQGTNVEINLDLDYFLVQPDSFDLGEVTEWLETAHANVECVFEGCLKDPARKLFQ